MTAYIGTLKVGTTAQQVFTGPAPKAVMFQNQGALPMVIGLNPELETDSVTLEPMRSFLAQAGVSAVWARVPLARQGTKYRLFFSEVEEPENGWMLPDADVADLAGQDVREVQAPDKGQAEADAAFGRLLDARGG